MVKQRKSDRSCLVLHSGGIDSTTCIQFMLERGYEVSALHVDYGQPANGREADAARAISEHYGHSLSFGTARSAGGKAEDLSRGRNLLLLALALVRAPSPGVVVIGIHLGSEFPDCDDAFIEETQRLYDRYALGGIQILAPFSSWSKVDIWHYAKRTAVPLHLTYSCDLGGEQPCGACSSCKDLEALRALT